MRKERRKFLEYMYNDLAKQNVEIRLEHDIFDNDPTYEQYGDILGIYEKGAILVNTAEEDWFETYVHEYMHFRQDQLQTMAWRRWAERDWTDHDEQLYILGLVEREAEQMVLLANRMFNLGIDEALYEEDAETVLNTYGVEW